MTEGTGESGPTGGGPGPHSDSPRPAGANGGTPPGAAGPIDTSRVRSFIGLSIGLVGPRANLAVSGVLITLYVQQRASGALAVRAKVTASAPDARC